MGERTAPMEWQVWLYAAGLVRLGMFKIAEVRAGGGFYPRCSNPLSDFATGLNRWAC